MKFLKTYKQLENISNSKIKEFVLEYCSDQLTYSKKYPRNSEYVKNLLDLGNLEDYYDGFKVEYGRLYIYFNENMIEDIFNIEKYRFNDFLTMYDNTYDCEIDELQYFIDDKSQNLLEQILKIFDISNIDSVDKLDNLINHRIYGCNMIINQTYSDLFHKKAKEIEDKIDYFFFDIDTTNYENLAIIIYKDYLDDIQSISNLLENKKISNIMSDIEIIKNTILDNNSEKIMNIEINKKLKETYNYLSKNKQNIITDMYKNPNNIVQYIDIGGDFSKELTTAKYQQFFIDNRKSTKLDNIETLTLYVDLEPTIKKKYNHILKAKKFNL